PWAPVCGRRPPTSRGCGCSSSRCRMCGSAAARAIPPTSSRCGMPTTTSCCFGRPASWPRSRRCPGWSMSRPTANRAACKSMSRSTASRPRGSGCACETSPMRSTIPTPNGRSRRFIPSATSIASFSKSTRNYQRDPTDLARVYVSGANNTQVPLSAVTTINRGLSPLVVNHQGQFPAITISFSLDENTPIEQATRLVDQAVAELHIPDTLHAEYAGDARAYRQSIGAQPLLILAALFAVYIVLGVLYESLAHPLTIISTLPSAGLGALLALQIFNAELSLIAFIGIILLIGIVKKNGIMMVDFALE